MSQNRKSWSTWAGTVDTALDGYVPDGGGAITRLNGVAGALKLDGTGGVYEFSGTASMFQFGTPATSQTSWEIKGLISEVTLVANQTIVIAGNVTNDHLNWYGIQLNPTNSQVQLIRTVAGSGAVAAFGSCPLAAGAMVWLRLTRNGNVLTGYTSPDGYTWTQVFSFTDGSPISGSSAFGLYNGGTVPLSATTGQHLRDTYAGDLVTTATSYSMAIAGLLATGVGSTLTCAIPANTALDMPLVITLSDGSVGGAFSPTTITLPANQTAQSGTSTYTPGSTLNLTLAGATPNGLITNPSLSYIAGHPLMQPSLMALAPNTTTTVTITNAGASWQSAAPVLSASGVTGVILGTPTVVSNTKLTVQVTTGSNTGNLSIADATTQGLCQITVDAVFSQQAVIDWVKQAGVTPVSPYVIVENQATGQQSAPVSMASSTVYPTTRIAILALAYGVPYLLHYYAGDASNTHAYEPVNLPRANVGGYASGQDPGSLVLAIPGNKLAVDSSGRVVLQPGEHSQIQTDVTAASPLLGVLFTVADINSTTTVFRGGSELSSVNDDYNQRSVKFLTGANAKSGARQVKKSLGQNKQITLSKGFPNAPAMGDTGIII